MASLLQNKDFPKLNRFNEKMKLFQSVLIFNGFVAAFQFKGKLCYNIKLFGK